MIKKINWDKQAEQFLKMHNWKVDQGIGYHPCYPLGEDLSFKGAKLRFCEKFYGEAWKAHKAVISGMVMLKNVE